MKVLVSAWGTAGDVLPTIAVGWELRRRGHEVIFAGSPYFLRAAREAGLAFVPTGREGDHERMMADSALFDRARLKSFQDIIEEHYCPQMESFFRVASEAFNGGAQVLVGGEIGSLSAAEARGVPWVQIACSPESAGVVSQYDPVHPQHLLPRACRWLARTGGGLRLYLRLRELRHGHWRRRRLPPNDLLGELLRIGPISAFRKSKGLAVQIGPSRSATACMWPTWFAPPQPDWPQGARNCGFPLYPRPRAAASPAERLRGPVIVTTGSMAASQFTFFALSVAACVALGREAILVTPHRDHLPAELPDGVKHLAHAPFDELIGRSALVVHHGGIGTASYAIAAGVPQLILPIRGDQFDNANRVCRLGVGRMLSVDEQTVEDVQGTMRDLLENPDVRRRCRHWQQRTIVDEGLRAAADMIEATALPQAQMVRPPSPARATMEAQLAVTGQRRARAFTPGSSPTDECRRTC